MKRDWSLTPESLEALLGWLDEDRERAGLRYLQLRERLVKLFAWRGCGEPERLADVTIDRVARRVTEGEAVVAADRYAYFHGVALNVMRESWREPGTVPIEGLAVASPAAGEEDVRLRCVERCLSRMPVAHRALLERYHQGEKKGKIDGRVALAEELRVGLNALRIRVFRLRQNLHACVEKCLAKSNGEK